MSYGRLFWKPNLNTFFLVLGAQRMVFNGAICYEFYMFDTFFVIVVLINYKRSAVPSVVELPECLYRSSF